MNRKPIRTRIIILLITGLLLQTGGSLTLTPAELHAQSSTCRGASGSEVKTSPSGGGTGRFGRVYIDDRRDEAAREKARKKAPIRLAAATSEPYANSEVDTLGTIMSDQMNAAFSNSGSANAVFETVSADELASLNASLNTGNVGERFNFTDIVSKVNFQIPTNKLPASVLASGNASSALFFIEQAISRYSSLCCLFTLANLTIMNSTATLTVYCPIPKDQIAETTRQYNETMTEIMRVPRSNGGMTESDKILYLHDEIVAMSEYANGRTNTYAVDYTPVGVMLNNLGVCQSYAAVFNQGARLMGLTDYVIDSPTHAWNAILVGGSWYYVDTTWDDTRSYGQEKDYIRHDYLLVDPTAFSSSHQIDSEYLTYFPDLTSRFGHAFDDYYPKKHGITSQMGYLGGYFYFSEDNKIKRWDRTNKVDTFDKIPVVPSRRVATMGGLLYVSGSDGMYQSDYSLNGLNKVSNTPFTGMYEAANRLYVSSGSSFYIFHDITTAPATSATPSSSLSPLITPLPINPGSSSPTPSAVPTPTVYSNIPTVPPLNSFTPAPAATYTPFPYTTQLPIVTQVPGYTASPAPTATIATAAPSTEEPVSIKKPGKTRITKLTNIKKRSVKIRWKKIKSVAKYQVQYSPSSTFSTKQTRHSLTNSVVIANLYKNKTYYFRVRAVRIQRGTDGIIYYKYGSWSAKKKKKIKK